MFTLFGLVPGTYDEVALRSSRWADRETTPAVEFHTFDGYMMNTNHEYGSFCVRRLFRTSG